MLAEALPLAEFAEICRKYRVREMAMFGSSARGDARPNSDVDLFVEFDAGFHPGLGWFDLEEDLERLLGRKVDLNRKALLKPNVRREALRDAIQLYIA